MRYVKFYVWKTFICIWIKYMCIYMHIFWEYKRHTEPLVAMSVDLCAWMDLFYRLPETLLPLGITGARLRIPFKPTGIILSWWSRSFREPLIGALLCRFVVEIAWSSSRLIALSETSSRPEYWKLPYSNGESSLWC